jgi:hypothetical protein
MKYVTVTGAATFRLYPGQTIAVRKLKAKWAVRHPGLWRPQKVAVCCDILAPPGGGLSGASGVVGNY